MKNKKIGKVRIQVVFGIMIAVYILAIGLTSVILFQIPNFYLAKQETVYEEIQENIQAILKGCKYEFAVNYKPDYFYRYVTNSVSSKSSQRKQTHFPGHIYLLSKVVKSLSEDQKIYYRDDLDNYYLNFSHISVDKKYGSTFCKTDWIRGRSWFIFRMKILAKTHPKARILLFPKLGLQHNCMLKKWHCCMKKTAHDFVSKYKNN